jgi:RNA polymerase sigma-70 factor (ECF subfamily)
MVVTFDSYRVPGRRFVAEEYEMGVAVPQAISIARMNCAAWDKVDDVELVRRIRGGETALYEIVMRRYNRRIYRVARAILRSDSEAEDVMQETYVRAYEHLNEFAGSAKFATWLTKIAVYEAWARLRRQGLLHAPASTSGANLDIISRAMTDERDPERQTYDGELRSILERAIEALPENYRSVFILRVVEGLDVNETAAALGIGTEAVKTRLHRGRALLRKELERRAGIVAPELFPFHLSRCDRVVESVMQRISGRSGSGPHRYGVS